MNPHYQAVADRARHRCEYATPIFNFPFEVEHITPPGRGGVDDLHNRALACRSCNLFKSDQTEARDTQTQTTVRLFHPRHDLWSAHFDVDGNTGAIRGKTPIGRATCEALRMNSNSQCTARHQWMRLGLFP